MEVYRSKLNKDIIQQILDSFVELTDIRAAYFDIASSIPLDEKQHSHEHLSEHEKGIAIIGKNKPLCGFCEALRVNSEALANCLHSDKLAFKKAGETGKPYVYKCHMGLYEAVVPLFIKNRLTGCLMLGQVACNENSRYHLKELEEKLSRFGICGDQLSNLLEAYRNTTSFPVSRIQAAANMLNIIAQHIINSDIIHIYDIKSIEKAKIYIQQHYKRALPAAEIALAADLSPSYLSYLFKRETGSTITGYIDNLRINEAKELLELTSKSIKEISFLLGYSDQNYFSRIFKKHEGISPMEFRTKNKKSC